MPNLPSTSYYLRARLREAGLDSGVMECPADLQVLAFDSARKSGVYFLFHRGEVVYVGSAKNIYHRVGKHSLDKEFDTVKWMAVEPDQMRKVEGYWILALKPRLNGHTDARGNRKYFAPAPLKAPAAAPPIKREPSDRIKRIIEEGRLKRREFLAAEQIRYSAGVRAP
jgi:GIY-YIG catalytic domain